ncbi:hypothetical protein KDX27_28545 [Burkholderia cenocepacia]|uniref:hypothetical protein n=1 Tax=Burkholderia cenocepacia TaxID=95486 RepID=UPI001B9A6A77|nr:hypothetical protein [Burkholderia cenocepacia]MBR8029334.1 hypothetical protein [Burkholderia cenocepacia]MBR8171681.1 hypothetical protein [Burkholderia cenocepacia]
MAENFVHIHAPAPVEETCQVNLCPTCERPRRMFVRYFEWYGATVTCAGCGEEWQDGYQSERPLMCGWRKQNIQYAIRNLDRIGVKA